MNACYCTGACKLTGVCPNQNPWKVIPLHGDIDALRRDAARYRWLRERHSTLTRMECARGLGLDLSKVYVNTVEKFDAAIDAAMRVIPD